ncbi:penicillin acylase family protein [Streptomyces alfalfae]|uniref:Penicillin acylase n=1 Tax=Streptomyces alfalfae TaxID=1642299 RepID=A0ABN4VNE5_9ACTN|nr:penicillin acylase family protein [Streptomyces alfalfae]AYA19535.1 penicillin acylase family protein [Streptomyces fradiae]APY89113.1 penicillin acylase [Streptomyces alfalfae]QUI30941.1 penicillin acylase family protein [Streptomyces alfalfae]RXX40935.1 penicillin acylase family protein [Streptomyces alfalfae]RZN03116.1 penicillin acylase family protein [Streptomyces alfalfae]
MGRRNVRLRTFTAGAALALGAALLTPLPGAAAAPDDPGARERSAEAADYCGSQCADVLPPGANGNATLAEILAHRVLGTQPAHADDQLGPYDALSSGYTSLTDDKLTEFFDDASFGVREGQVASVTRPREDVTITRDKKYGIPHVKGTTRYGTEFGAGFAAGQDRLWLIDLFRHIGRGQLTSFAGGAPANQGLEQQFWPQAPYTEADLEKQVEYIRSTQGERGKQAMEDAQAYVDGLNAYRVKSKNGRYFPGEYVLTGKIDAITNKGEIEPFKITDMIALASVVGGLFGNGGGGEVESALSLLKSQEKYGVQKGTEVWESFRARNDPEAVRTIHDGTSFPYANKPDKARGTALPDPGSVEREQLVYDREGGARTGAKDPVKAPKKLKPAQGMYDEGVLPEDLFRQDGHKKGMSNALLVSGKHTASKNPVAVFGPQTGYFAPQLLMQQELQGPGISARGVSFAGVGMYVQLGRGQDYAWSATSAGQDITDTYAVELCEPGGGTPTKQSTGYLYRGTCTPMEKLERKNAWQPTVADSTAAGSYRMQVFRTKYGVVTHRASVDGAPVAYVSLRSTYRHEADSIIGFQMLNDPSYVKDAATFQKAAQHISYAFNWFYADSRDIAYYNSGANPVRAEDVDPALPVKGEQALEWRDFDPADNTSAQTPPAEHPHSVNQDYYISWNNKQADDFSTAGFGMSAVHRGDLLDGRVKKLTEAGGVTRAALTRAMSEAAVTDLRGEQVLPELLKVLRSKPVTDPRAAEAVQQLDAWQKAGARRNQTAAGSKTYAHPDAVRIMDAWWPKLIEAQFEPGLGKDLYAALTAQLATDEAPSAGHGPTGAHAGSAFQYGWWGYADKDLRTVLGEPVKGALGDTFCGGGDLDACRDALLTTLTRAAARPATEVYPGDDACKAGDQWCADSIIHRALGGITHKPVQWQNRPTYQQVVEFPRHR